MHETTRLQGLVQERLNDVVTKHRQELAALGNDTAPILDEATGFLAGGKRYRAYFTVLGYKAAKPLDIHGPVTQEFGALLDAACALELFHAAALIHDDIIDSADTRRGRPATHKLFAALHQQQGWRGDGEQFGISCAILLGDLLQSWADELFQKACSNSSDPAAAGAARQTFNTMRSEVALGQYLDVVEEHRQAFAAYEEQMDRSTRVLVYKSAKYSVEAPLLIGAALAGADSSTLTALSEFGIQIGVAYQLRDDLLGVFGNEQLTGKPAGDDLREGKRTVLATLAREALSYTHQTVFDEMLGSDLTDAQVGMLQRTIQDSGAVQQVEKMIANKVERAEEVLHASNINQEAKDGLLALAQKAAQRDF